MARAFTVALVVVALKLVAGAGTAWSQVPEKAAAESLFQSGRELATAGRWPEACEKFAASHDLDPALGTMLHLADCYERVGKTASAWALFEEAASLATVAGQTSRAEIARERAGALAKDLARVKIVVPESARVDGLTVTLSGMDVPRASWGTTIPLDPGAHDLVVSAPGRVTSRSSVTVGAAGATPEVIIPQLDVATAAPTPVQTSSASPPIVATVAPLPEPRRGTAQRVAGIVIGSVGLGGVTVGAVFGVQAISKNDQSLDQCRPDDATRCTPIGVELRRQAEDFALGSTIALAAGGALLATGLVVYFTAPRLASERAARVAVAPRPGGGALSLGGTF